MELISPVFSGQANLGLPRAGRPLIRLHDRLAFQIDISNSLFEPNFEHF